MQTAVSSDQLTICLSSLFLIVRANFCIFLCESHSGSEYYILWALKLVDYIPSTLVLYSPLWINNTQSIFPGKLHSMLTFLLFDRHFGIRGVTLDNFDNNLIVVRQDCHLWNQTAYLGTLLKCTVYFLIFCYVSAAFFCLASPSGWIEHCGYFYKKS